VVIKITKTIKATATATTTTAAQTTRKIHRHKK
jgi:hypothetical protein